MKLESIKSALKDELHQLGFEAEEAEDELLFDYVIDQNHPPLHYRVRFNTTPHTIDVRVHWDLVADPLTSELLTFLSYLNSVEKHGHFYVESRDSKVYYKMSIFYRDFTPELERTRRLFSIPVRSFGSGSNALRAILQMGEPVIDVYHWWIKEVLDTKESERTGTASDLEVDQTSIPSPESPKSPVSSESPEGDDEPVKGGTNEP